MLSLAQTIPAGRVEPVTIEQAKEQLHIKHEQENAYIGFLVTAARKTIELLYKREFITSTWTYKLDNFPASGTFLLPKTPLQLVTSVTYTDTSGSPQEVAGTVYDWDTARMIPPIFLKYGQSWPTCRGHTNDITIVFKTGYGDATTDVPEPARQAILIMMADMYENRESVVVGAIPSRIASVIDALLSTVEVPIVA